MFRNPAYNQLLALIIARSQQWLRNQIDRMPAQPDKDDTASGDLAEIAASARICSTFRGTTSPIQTYVESRLTQQYLDNFLKDIQKKSENGDYRGLALQFLLSPGHLPRLSPRHNQPLVERLAASGQLSDPLVLAEVEALLRRPVPEEQLTDHIIGDYARLLSFCYRFGAERPRFADVRTYGDAFANCLRFAQWAQRKGRLTPLAQMCFCLCLIDPDHDATPMLSDIISSQRPDGSFPMRLGFGTADQDRSALQPTLAVIAALHVVVHRRCRGPQPSVPMAA